MLISDDRYMCESTENAKVRGSKDTKGEIAVLGQLECWFRFELRYVFVSLARCVCVWRLEIMSISKGF